MKFYGIKPALKLRYDQSKKDLVILAGTLAFRLISRLVLALLVIIFSLKTAVAQIAPITTDSRIRTLVYNPNEVYELKFFYGYQSFIEFEEQEEIETLSIGEAFAWRITPAGKRLFIRPLEIGAHTNMTIITNLHIYNLDIRSGEYNGKADEELVYTVRFYYPQFGQPIPVLPPVGTPPSPPPSSQPPLVSGGAAAAQTRSPNSEVGVFITKKFPGELERNPDGLPLNFDYSLAGRDEGITPIKVYDNTKETFFKFRNDNLLVPSIAAVDAFGTETPLKYRVEDGYVVVKSIEQQFTLRMATSLICVFNNKAISAAGGARR